MTRLFNHYIHWRTVAQIAFDFAFVVAVLLTIIMWVGSGLPVDWPVVVGYSVILSITVLMMNAWLGMYQRVHRRSIYQTRARAVLTLYLSVPVAYGLFVLLSIGEANKEFFEISTLTAVFGMLTHRVFSVHTVAAAKKRSNVLVVGTGERAAKVDEALRKSDPYAQVIGFYPSPNEQEVAVPRDMILPNRYSLTDTALKMHVDEIVVAVGERRGGSLPLREMLDCKLNGVQVMDLATHFEKTLGQIRLESLYAGWLIFGEGFDQRFARTALKRLSDILAALVLLAILWPVMLITAVAIVLESGFPVLYRQERVGLNGRLFNVTKFRSMRTDAEKDGTPRWAAKGDARVTRVGRFIRKTRIDELPQLFNVLVGDMSMVGPRPERPYFVDQLTRDIPFYSVRHSVKPGVTGWAQIRYHYAETVKDTEEKLQYDLYYVKNHSLFLDTVILFDTVGVVLTGKGAQ